jgi:hypothetical protein
MVTARADIQKKENRHGSTQEKDFQITQKHETGA